MEAIMGDAVVDLRPAFTAHDITERDRLLRARGYAEEIARRPELVEQARGRIDRAVTGGECTLGERLWQRVLREPVGFVVDCMLRDDPEGRLLRSNNPFSVLMGPTDQAERRETWRQAREDLSRSAI
jgi:hypothetical protein